MSDSIRILFTGDFCPRGPVEELCRKHDWGGLFGNALPVLQDKDLSIVNLECPLTDTPNPIRKSGPHLIAPTLCADALTAMSADVAALANNHILDQGATGLTSTMNACRERGVATVGAGESRSIAAAPLFIERNGIRVAIINVAENEFATTHNNTPGAAPLDPTENARAIRDAAAQADFVIVVAHGGHELYPLPSPRMVNLYRFFVEMGASAVIGHHPHVVSAWGMYRNAPIFYSLGNFIFPWTNTSAAWQHGLLARLTLRRGEPVEIERIHTIQNDGNSFLRLMTPEETIAAEQELTELNAVLADETELGKRWQKWADVQANSTLMQLLGLNRWQRKLFKMGIWRARLGRHKDLPGLLNRVRCESHRDVLLAALRKELQNSRQS